MGSASLVTSSHPTTRSWDRTAWPHDARLRWTLRLACALPLVAIAVAAARAGVVGPELAQLSDRADVVRNGQGLNELASAYPPLPTLVAAALPAGPIWISVISALMGGFALHLLLARLVRREPSLLLGALLIAALVVSPAVWFQATQNPSQFMALMFLVVAVDGFIRFIVREDTAGGFASGLALAGACLCDPAGLVYLLALAASGPLLAKQAGFTRRNRAAILVLVFPSISTLLSWAFLEWRFAGSAFATVWQETDAFRFDGATIGRSVADVGSTLTMSIVFVAVTVVVVRRRPRAAATLAVPLIGMVLAALLGVPFGAGLGLVLLTVVGLYSLPRRLHMIEQLGLGVAAVLQIGIVSSWALSTAELQPFIDALL